MVVLESEKGELKKKVSKFMIVSVAYFSSMVSAWYRFKVLLQTWKIPKQDMIRRKRLTYSSKRIVFYLLF